jgi:hypothetical protein
MVSDLHRIASMSAEIVPGFAQIPFRTFQGVDGFVNVWTTIGHRSRQTSRQRRSHGDRSINGLRFQPPDQHSQAKNGQQSKNGQKRPFHVASSIKRFDYLSTAMGIFY